MLRAFTDKYTDESTAEEFSFTFFCDLCKKPWKSVPIPFSQAQQKTFLTNLLGIKSSVWKEEHKDAFERANREAMLHFNRCVKCKKWVCDDDFSEDENICSECKK
jgi:hypothetical protein